VWLGTTLLLIGAAIRLTAVRTLGRQFTARVYLLDNHELRRSGLYARVRHPGYCGLALLNVAPAISMGAPAALVILTAATGASLSRRVTVEERVLEASLGSEWTTYAGRTPRWIPRARACHD